MDKITEQTNNMLFEVFGLCPEYKVQWTDSEWIEFYSAPDYKFTWRHLDSSPIPIRDFPERVRLHLNEHKTLLASGLCVSAHFAVHHPSKTIYLRIMKVQGGDAYCKVSNG
jgi:hypothetical protein